MTNQQLVDVDDELKMISTSLEARDEEGEKTVQTICTVLLANYKAHRDELP